MRTNKYVKIYVAKKQKFF